MILNEQSKTTGTHKKHAGLIKPAIGNFGRNEWAFIGAPCVNIKLLADAVIQALSPVYKCAYADTSHQDEASAPPGRIANGAVVEYTDQISYQQFNYKNGLKPYQIKQQFADADMVLVNGNHQQAKAQVVIIHEGKRASLQKRLQQLTNVQLILLDDRADDVFDFIKDALPDWKALPVFRLSDTENIINWFKAQMLAAKPVLNGLVLAGGKSTRMGYDKGAVNVNGKEQRYYMADMLNPYCKEVFISCRPEQVTAIHNPYPVLEDTFIGLGPFGAILSAFRANPNQALLVVACDLLLLDAATLAHLVANRNAATIATAYQSNFENFPEPLITIWEPKSYPVLLAFLAQGYSCPRKVLINSDITLLQAPDPNALTNVNTPEELDKIKRVLHQKISRNIMTPGFERYGCQITLPGFGETAQQLLQQASVLIVGAGGLGCPAAQYLAAAGIGTLGIADYDVVSTGNLHRQILYTPGEVGLKKATIACLRLQQQNPAIKLHAHEVKITAANVMDIIAGYQIIVDCTDNFGARYLLNDAGVLSGKPVVYGAIYQFEGQLAVWNIKNADDTFSPNYRDLFPQVDAAQIPGCADGGVIPTLAGIIGCMQANEVIKYITGTGDLLAGKLLIFDSLSMQSRIIKIGKVTNTLISGLPNTDEAPLMSVADVKKGLANNTLELLDIRTDQERDEIHIGGEHIEADELEDNLEYLDNRKTKVLYCSSGKRSAEAVKNLKKVIPGANLYSLDGGLQAWFGHVL